MKSRFEGQAGETRLLEQLAKQAMISGIEDHLKIAEEFVRANELMELSKGDELISQDSWDDDVFFIIGGSLDVIVNGRKVINRKAGTHVGEMSLVDPRGPRCATVRAAEKTLVVKVSHADFSRIANRYPALWKQIAIELCGRLRSRNDLIRPVNLTPRIFICSSSECLAYAEEIERQLRTEFDPKVWSQGVFEPSKYTLEDLEKEIVQADFAVALMVDDDVTRTRGKQFFSPRDNVVFEMGLFMGQIERKRTFMVIPTGVNLKLPSDLCGVNPIKFNKPTDKNDRESVSNAFKPVCDEIIAQIRHQWSR